MRRSAVRALPAAVLAMSLLPAAIRAGEPAALNEAAGLYHKSRFEDARARLETLLADGPWRRRDSLVLFQYLGMASSRLGRAEEAAGRFGALLALDSLFRFPRNEDPAVLRDFQAARDARIAPVTLPATPAPEDPAHADRVPAKAEETAPGETASDSNPAASARGAIPEPGDPLRMDPSSERPAMTLGLGAVPLGGGWMVRERMGHGLALGVLQAGGMLLSVYASDRQTRVEDDRGGTETGEIGSARGWQWVQRISLSTALGAYLYSIFAARGK